MIDKTKFISSSNTICHKGFYTDKNPIEEIDNIKYEDYFDVSIDYDDFPYETANSLISGSCHLFALALKSIFKYNIYILESKSQKGFHAFCQYYKNDHWFYIDARGVTNSFDEFVSHVTIFVKDEYIIRLATNDDINEWKSEFYAEYDEVGIEFAKRIINSNIGYYSVT